MEGPKQPDVIQQPGQDDLDVLDKTPELELKLIQKSKSPIDVINGSRKKISSIEPWNNYTLVVYSDSNEIRVFNEQAWPLPESSNFDTRVSVNWGSRGWVSKKFPGVSHLYTKGKSSSVQYLDISDIPIELEKFASAIRARHQNSDYISIGDNTNNVFDFSDVIEDTVTVSDAYVLGLTSRESFVVFLTKDENGIILPPRLWQRLNPTDILPEEVRAEASKILGKGEGYKKINDSYYVITTDVGINIFPENSNGKKTPVFSEHVSSVDKNITTDPSNTNLVYYCQTSNPRSITRLDTSGEPNTWVPISVDFEKSYESISNLQLDPSGNFFLFYSKDDLVVVSKDDLSEIKRIPGLRQVNFDSDGNIRAIDKDGYLVIYEPNFDEMVKSVDKRRVAKLAKGVNIADIFEEQAAKKVIKNNGGEGLEHLEPLRAQYATQFADILLRVTNQDGVDDLRKGFEKLRAILVSQGLKQEEISFVLSGLDKPIQEKEKEFAEVEARRTLVSVRAILIAGLSVTSVGEARASMQSIRSKELLLEEDLRLQIRDLDREVEESSVEMFKQRGGELIKDIGGLIERTKLDLEAFTTKSQMDDWLEFRFPQLKSRLGSLAKDVPIEADEAYKAIVHAREQLQEIATSYEEKFKSEYAKVREKAAERTGATVDLLAQDVDGLVERLKARGFTDRTDAERYLASSDAKKILETEIIGLAVSSPEVAKELQRGLKVRLSNALTEIERGALTKVADTGQQMVMFGKTLFPKWEAKVKVKTERKVDVVFEQDEKTHGPGVKAGDILGDVSVSVRGTDGKVEKVRLNEGWQDENDWRLGLLTYRGESIPPSYVSAKEFKDIRKKYTEWSSPDSELKTELQKRRDALKEIYSRRPEKSEKLPQLELVWAEEYKTKLQEYAVFVTENHISLLRRIDRIKKEPDIEHTNGRGFVPEWQSHWVMDKQTEEDLEEMATALDMQLKLQEGILNLKGHAGTGKDVRIKMFCSLTNRPYFGIDGTKWTTEFELSEDVMLESKDGASQTVKVPSAVLNGITTPGAIVYFNEFNAMPEQAQIFLHALMDEKRSLTLKTSSGKTIRALPNVLLVGSMNPGYPGTFDPQFATRSRMVSIDIGYPPLTRMPESGDKNRNPMYDSSEALRIARGMDSLVDLTYEANLEHNDFVRMWDKYINGIENGAIEPSSTQKFDMDVILALVQFANNLRDDFIKIFEKSREARNALPVTQPVTGRELRRAGYALSKMSGEEKATKNPENVARELLDKYFLTHIDKKEDQDKIRKTMNTWTSRKRVRA